MTYVVTDNCQKCRFTDCVTVCPVDCFHADAEMLYIDPDECIDCGACVPACPVEAIFALDEVPEPTPEPPPPPAAVVPVDLDYRAEPTPKSIPTLICPATLERGVALAPSPFEAAFLSAAHTPEDVATTIAAADAALEVALD